MLNQYGHRYLARLQTLLKEFHELADKGSTAHIGAKNKLNGFIDAGKATFKVNPPFLPSALTAPQSFWSIDLFRVSFAAARCWKKSDLYR